MNDQEDIAISVRGVSKDFKLPHQKQQSVKGAFLNMLSLGNRTYEMQHALKGIDFDVKKGEFFGIVGRNGSGKSTLLKILGGIYQPTKGSVKVNGRLVPFIELGVGFNQELTGRENVYLNGALLGFSEKEVQRKYDAIVDFAELSRFMDQKLKNYSSGMQVRLAFSVATVLAESDILLIDEVLAVGDAAFQRKCFNYFSNLKKLKKTVVFVSHDMSAIREYCDRALLINNNEMVQIGAPSEVATLYTRLFNEEASDDNKNGNIWGDSGVVFKKIVSTKKTLDAGVKTIKIVTTIQANQDVEHPIVGFLVKNASGQALIGTNTKIEKRKIGSLKKGDTLSMEWSIPNIFSDGTYVCDFAITHADGVGIYQWHEEAVKLTVKREVHVPYSIAPEIGVTFTSAS